MGFVGCATVQEVNGTTKTIHFTLAEIHNHLSVLGVKERTNSISLSLPSLQSGWMNRSKRHKREERVKISNFQASQQGYLYLSVDQGNGEKGRKEGKGIDKHPFKGRQRPKKKFFFFSSLVSFSKSESEKWMRFSLPKGKKSGTFFSLSGFLFMGQSGTERK